MKWRLMLEIELPAKSSADDALEWFSATIARGVSFVALSAHPYRPRVVSVTPVTKGKEDD